MKNHLEHLKQYSVLVIDDDRIIAEELAEYLSIFFKNVYKTTSAESAQEIYEEHKIDIAFVDIKLPGINGFSLIQKMKKITPDTKYVIISAYDDKENILKALKMDIFDFVRKPILSDTLQNLLKKLSITLNDKKRELINLPENFYWDNKNHILLQDDKAVKLSDSEIKLLTYFINNLNKAIDGYDLFESIWKDKNSYNPKSIRNLISKLRKKLPYFMTIRNIYGGKYILTTKEKPNTIKDIVEQQVRFTAMLPFPVVAIDLDCNIIYKNSAFDKNYLSISKLTKKCFSCIFNLKKPCKELGYECPKDNTINLNNISRVTREIKIFREKAYIDIVAHPIKDIKDNILGLALYIHDVTSHFKQYNKLQLIAKYDKLTKVANRTLLEEKIDESIQRSNRFDNMFAILFMDIDNFKDINDTFGHLIGDKLLKKFADRLKKSVRKSDIIARYGGDEFVIVMNSIKDKNSLKKVVKDILKYIEKKYIIDNIKISCSCSIGVSIYKPHCNKTKEDLLIEADSAMYDAKRNGKSSYKIF